MNLSYDGAAKLFQDGEFLQLVNASGYGRGEQAGSNLAFE